MSFSNKQQYESFPENEFLRSLLVLTELHFQLRKRRSSDLSHSCSLISCLPVQGRLLNWWVIWTHLGSTCLAIWLSLARMPYKAPDPHSADFYLIQASPPPGSLSHYFPPRMVWVPSLTSQNTPYTSLSKLYYNYAYLCDPPTKRTDSLQEGIGFYSFLYAQDSVQENAINMYAQIN